jgi:hypothetical protein
MGFWGRVKDDIELYRVEAANARTPKPDHVRVRAYNLQLQKAERAAARAEGRQKRPV